MVRYIFVIIFFLSFVFGLVTSDVDKYLGCYRNFANQSLSSQNSVNQSMTIDFCINSCIRYNSTFAGLKKGNQCLCGEDFNELVSEINCTKECSGNNSQYCGGTNEQSIAVYSVCSIGYFGIGCDKVCHCNQQAPCNRMTGKCPTGCDDSWIGQACDTADASPAKSNWYVGCYGDGNPQAMDLKNTEALLSKNNPTNFCINLCAQYNYTYMGTQYYRDCNCGEINICTRYGPSNGCTYECSGNKSQICGGNFVNSVYSVCPTGSFSLNCLSRCNCMNDSRCIYRNGTCPAGCEPGWTGDSCSFRDCSVKNGSCNGPNESCETIDLKYVTKTRCGCKKGYTRDKPWTNCKDIDECLDIDSFCGSDAYNCTNTIGSFICGYCPEGQIVQNGSCLYPPTTTINKVSEPKSNTGMIVGIVLGVFFALLIVTVVGIILYRRKLKTGQNIVEKFRNAPAFAPKIKKKNVQEQNIVNENNYQEESTYVNCVPGQSRINVDSLVEVVKHINETPGDLQKEFKSVTDDSGGTTEVGKRKEFKKKNRFKNIIPYDNNRVILSKSGSQDQTDYINASYIKGYRETDNLIASQGPTPESTDDFWRMVLEKRVSVIAMITNLMESGKKKCEKYWPDVGEVLAFGEVTVSSVSEEKWHDFVKRSLLAKRHSITLSVTQWHYTEWPDHGVPQNVRSFLAYRRKVRDSMTAESFAVIHCSAGAGRTGSFLAIDYLLEESKTGYVDVLSCFRKLRQQRTQMIQTLEQYKFVYNALADQLRTGETALKRDDYEKRLNELQTKDPVSGTTKLDCQFQTLDQQNRADTENSKYAGYPEALEVQGTRPHVHYIVKSISSTEKPDEIWKLQSDRKSKLIILINENQDEVSFVPTEGKPLDTSQINLTLDSSTEEHYVTVNRIKLIQQSVYANETGASEAQTITLLNVHATSSPNRDAIDYESLSNAYAAMNKHSKTRSDPAIIVSLNDERLSGFLVAAFNAFDMITDENEVDVYQIVHDLRMSNPRFIPTLNAYEELHNGIKHFIESTV